MTSVTRSDDSTDIARVRLSTPFVVQIIAWIVGALMVYAAMSARIAVIETRQGESDRRISATDGRMERIENKLDRVLERLK
jgi:hypothetical protein